MSHNPSQELDELPELDSGGHKLRTKFQNFFHWGGGIPEWCARSSQPTALMYTCTSAQAVCTRSFFPLFQVPANKECEGGYNEEHVM